MPLETLTLNVKWFLFEPEAQGIDSCFDFNSEAYGTVLLAEKAIISIMTTLAPSSQQFALIVHVSMIRDIYFAGSVKPRTHICLLDDQKDTYYSIPVHQNRHKLFKHK